MFHGYEQLFPAASVLIHSFTHTRLVAVYIQDLLSLGHSFCLSCISCWLTQASDTRYCPTCRSAQSRPPVPNLAISAVIDLLIPDKSFSSRLDAASPSIRQQQSDSLETLFQSDNNPPPLPDDEDGVVCPTVLIFRIDAVIVTGRHIFFFFLQ